MTVISLLRGINLGGHRKVPMSDLRAVYESLGFVGARTYIQSGNVVCRAPGADPAKLKVKIETAIKHKFGFHSEVVLRTLPEWNRVIANNPLAGPAAEHPAKLLVLFLSQDPGREARDALLRIDATPEEIRAVEREVYIHYPNGMARPKLPLLQIDKLLRTPVTGRNWNTVLKLRDLAQEIETT